MAYRCIVIATSNLNDFPRIQEVVEMLVTSSGGVHQSNNSRNALSKLDGLLERHPIVSIATEYNKGEKLPLGNAMATAPERGSAEIHNQLFEKYTRTRKELQNVSRSLSKILWQWVPDHIEAFRGLRACKLVDSMNLTVGGEFGDYMITGKGGHGASGTIFSSSKYGDPRPYALKLTNKLKLLTTKAIVRAAAEINVLHGSPSEELHRHNILPILEIMHSSSHMCYSMELFGTNSFQFSKIMNEGSHSRDKNTMKIITSIIAAVQHIHALGYAHRDIKSENILVCAASADSSVITDVRLIDFGIACRLDDHEACCDLCGTRGFIAPESIIREVRDLRKVDVWSLACVVLERSLGAEWFEQHWFSVYSSFDYNQVLTAQDICALYYACNTALELLAQENACIFNFLQQALVFNPERRSSFLAVERPNHDLPSLPPPSPPSLLPEGRRRHLVIDNDAYSSRGSRSKRRTNIAQTPTTLPLNTSIQLSSTGSDEGSLVTPLPQLSPRRE